MIIEAKKPELESAVKLLMSLDLTKEQSHSILVKMWFLIHRRKEHLRFDDNREISIESILETSSESWRDVLHDFEYYKVSKIRIGFDHFSKVRKFLEKIHINILMYAIKDDQSIRREGQFYSPNWIVDKIVDQIKNDIQKPAKFTVIDFAAGLGYFFESLLGIPHSDLYAVELDPLTFEAMIFGFLMNSPASSYQKMKLILTVKQGDSLLGYNEELFNKFCDEPRNKEILIEYVNTRTAILDIETKDISELLKECFRLRNEISRIDKNFNNFNWFIDFPELFIDAFGNKLAEPGVDYVIGNPPWIKYADIDLEKYKDIFNYPLFAELMQGKFNFYLPFAILAYQLSKIRGGLILPQTLFTESYAQKFREFLFNKQTPYQIRLYGAKGFRNVINEFCTLLWDKRKKSDKLELISKKIKITSEIDYLHIKPPFYRLPLFPENILKEISDITERWNKLNEFIITRRGFTLTRKYQNEYRDLEDKNIEHQLKKIVRNSIFTGDEKKGVFNFQVFYSGDEFVYDKQFLGAPANAEIFEQPKIIRRNRGRKWFLGLDIDQNLYVNDIFDIIYSINEDLSLKALFGYLCSSFIQLLTEGYLQRDITSNIIRFLPIPDFQSAELKLIEDAVDCWLISEKTLIDFRNLRKKIDYLLSNTCDFSSDLINYLQREVVISWKEL